MLQSEAEYIDARPHQPASTKASCTARPDHTFGSKPEKLHASICFPLCPEERTLRNRVGMSVSCHKQTLVALPSHVTRSANQASVTVFSMTCPRTYVGHRE